MSRVMFDWQSSQVAHEKFCGKTKPHWEQNLVWGFDIACEKTTGTAGIRRFAMGL